MYTLIHCGGSTFQGLAIYNLLKQHKAIINTYIDGIAASSASIIAMAGDKIYIPKTSLIMIHNCWTWVTGNAKDLRKTAEDMDKIAVAYKEAYLSKIKITEEKLEQLLADETYLTADECIEFGFADEIIELKGNTSINQYASLSILKLVNKVKEKEQKYENKSFTEEEINKLAEKISNKILEPDKTLTDERDNQKSKGLNNSPENNLIRKDSWESFFNKKINKKEGKKHEN